MIFIDDDTGAQDEIARNRVAYEERRRRYLERHAAKIADLPAP
jgi:hypothetical protein